MDYNTLNMKELKKICISKNIKNYSKLNKEQIIELCNKTDNHLSPLFKWSGGKSDEINIFKSHIPNDIDTYIEPFCGAGALFFYLNHSKNVINDVHTELIDFYKSIKDGQANIIYDFMNKYKNTEEDYYKVRDNFIVKNYIDNACKFYYLRKTCYRGMLRYNSKGKFNIPYGNYKTINYENLKNDKYNVLLNKTEIFNESYEYIFNKFNDGNNFMFLDPPYDSKFTDYGYCKFDKEEQTKLCNLFKNTNNRCLLIINKTDFISEIYNDYIVDEYHKNYKFRLQNGKIKTEDMDAVHYIIKNY